MEGVGVVPVWWGLLIAYLAVIFLAAAWAIVERTRSTILERTPRSAGAQTLYADSGELPTPLAGEIADSMTERELEAEQEATQPLFRSG